MLAQLLGYGGRCVASNGGVLAQLLGDARLIRLLLHNPVVQYNTSQCCARYSQSMRMPLSQSLQNTTNAWVFFVAKHGASVSQHKSEQACGGLIHRCRVVRKGGMHLQQ